MFKPIKFFFLVTLIATGINYSWSMSQCNTIQPNELSQIRFNINSKNGEIYDRKTKLTWKICPERMKYINGHCLIVNYNISKDPEDQKCLNCNWMEAKIKASHIVGWRLPNEDELMSIVDKQCSYPSINSKVFPNTPSLSFWTNSDDRNNSDYAYIVNFERGFIDNDLKTSNHLVRLVKGVRWIRTSH